VQLKNFVPEDNNSFSDRVISDSYKFQSEKYSNMAGRDEEYDYLFKGCVACCLFSPKCLI
jgi:hypothetical protein